MDSREDVRDFLRSRRAKITPEQANLIGGGNRRVAGLRREEVAILAGVSVDYYARLERGDLSGVSDEVLDALARALQLDEAEIAHLFDLARAAQPSSSRRRRAPASRQVRPSLQRFLDSITNAPAWVRNERMDFIAANSLGRALYAPHFVNPEHPLNNARFVFLDPASHEFYPDWERGATDIVATLRGYAGRNPNNRDLTDLIGELVTRSEHFRTLWAAHNVRHHRTGTKKIHHPIVGDLELTYEAMEFPADPGWTMFAYTADPGSASAERLQLLSSYAATLENEAAAIRNADAPTPVSETETETESEHPRS